jgi:4-amino-4-deoxy-L-arabinose transferase-like glycosyltransferase
MAGSLGWILYGQMLMYDALLTACVLLALIGVWRAGATVATRAWWLVAAGIGLGILAKGPVALLHIGVPALLGPLWSKAARARPLAWYGRLFAALLGGLLIAGSWAGLAAWMGGDEYARMIFLEQTSGRLVKSFAHGRPWWVYLLFVPLLVLPWIILPSVWRGMLKDRLSGSQRFLLSWAVGCVLVLSLVSGKQPHYAVPEIPALMLLAAGWLSLTWTPRRIARMAAAWVVTVLALLSIVMWNMFAEYDMGPPGRLVHDLQEDGVAVATTGYYKNQLAFPGRLTQALHTIDRSEIKTWLEDNPGGVIVTFKEELPEHYGLEVFTSFSYRRGLLRVQGLPENRPLSLSPPPET